MDSLQNIHEKNRLIHANWQKCFHVAMILTNKGAVLDAFTELK